MEALKQLWEESIVVLLVFNLDFLNTQKEMDLNLDSPWNLCIRQIYPFMKGLTPHPYSHKLAFCFNMVFLKQEWQSWVEPQHT